MPIRRNFLGPLLVAAAAALWATDSLFRAPTVRALDPTFIVFFEHLIGVIALVPFIFARYRTELGNLSAKEWISAVFIGVGGSAIATVLFTASFRYINPSVAILLQKLQPIIVVMISYLFLKERPAPFFFRWAVVALAAAIVVSFPDLDFSFLSRGLDVHSIGVIYAITAATVWAVATVAGKFLLKTRPSIVATFWRYVFGFGTLALLLMLSGIPAPMGLLQNKTVLIALLYMALIPGLAAMLAYYAGLSRTPASVTTFVELVFPVSAVILNTIYLHAPLNWVQVVAGSILLFAVTKISI